MGLSQTRPIPRSPDGDKKTNKKSATSVENFYGRTRFLNDCLEEPGHAEAHEDVEHVAESGFRQNQLQLV